MSPYKIDKISIIIPVYNGSKTVPSLFVSLQKEILPQCDLEIILINDGSPVDNSSEVCSGLAESNPNVRFIDLSRNFGEHNAVMAGLNYCTGDCAVIMDDDFQNPPQGVIKLVDELAKGYDVVFASYEKKKHHFLRNIGSRFNNYVASILIKKPVNLYLSSFKAINRFVIDEIIKYKGPYPYIDGLILRTTKRFSTVPVHHNSRKVGKSGYTFPKLVSLWLNMFTNFSILPLRIATFTGFILATIGLIMAVVVIIEKFRNPLIPIGYAALSTSILFLGSIQLLALGIIGEYLGRLFLKTNDNPQFVVRSSINCGRTKDEL